VAKPSPPKKVLCFILGEVLFYFFFQKKRICDRKHFILRKLCHFLAISRPTQKKKNKMTDRHQNERASRRRRNKQKAQEEEEEEGNKRSDDFLSFVQKLT
jgi:hypothetical protein